MFEFDFYCNSTGQRTVTGRTPEDGTDRTSTGRYPACLREHQAMKRTTYKGSYTHEEEKKDMHERTKEQ